MTVYVSPNYKTKKALKDAVKAGDLVTVFSAGLGSGKRDGRVAVEGPHYPAAHAWYATVEVADGVVTKVAA